LSSLGQVIIPELGTEFGPDYEEILIQYIYDNWSISDPPKPAAMEAQNEDFKLHVGFFDFNRPYEVVALQTTSIPSEVGDNGRRYQIYTTVEIGVRMRRLAKNKPDPQLKEMEREIKRIVMSYVNMKDITGIKNMVWTGQERIYGATDDHAKSDWRSVVRVNLQYENQPI
jgi:hypothetical protein